jgi:thiamine-phosphate pyrophosphorylase
MALLSPSIRLTEAVGRLLSRCTQLVSTGLYECSSGDILLVLLIEDESLASASLRNLGITFETLSASGLSAEAFKAVNHPSEPGKIEHSFDDHCGPAYAADLRQIPDDLSAVLEHASAVCRSTSSSEGVSTSHLLVGIIQHCTTVKDCLQRAGISLSSLTNEMGPEETETLPPLSVDFRLELESPTDSRPDLPDEPHRITHSDVINNESDLRAAHSTSRRVFNDETKAVWRILDAGLNRVREGLRVLEDHARFAVNSPEITRQLKSMRHRIVEAEQFLLQGRLNNSVRPDFGISSRDTLSDVGTQITTAGEQSRGSLNDVVTANYRRIQESLRSLEEFSKVVSLPFAMKIKQCRYELYTIEKHHHELIHSADNSPHDVASSTAAEIRHQMLARTVLCVLVTEESCHLPWKQFVTTLLSSSSTAFRMMIQLREKTLPAQEILRRARWISAACREAGSLCIINDHPEIARLSEADGVHLGQDDLQIADARQILLPGQLIGISTHRMDQARQAVADEADYLGAGPVFPSSTKAFDEFPGIQYVREIAGEQQIPWFAIGGISAENICEVISAGATRVAVSSAVAASDNPTAAAAELIDLLTQAEC